MKRAIGKKELLTIVPLSWSTIDRLEKKGEFPKRWHITDNRCAWNIEDIEHWLDERQSAEFFPKT
ncbi:TPA: AlpA family phage regulatory protein [Citrobacter koseri]|uniref:helix-turn-helix transcriptional regulator n=1 Tax=Citrobacter TaxID=544 RepID=UPI001A34442C|nr:AlpA family phage regulatory protein [Citrobacter farmeri]HAU5603359.1 AlpA family phage regulatory protein [Citrobacter koseri]HDQ2605273.1 AlpA family phage regulatory protein [Citrobacter koseri]HEM8505668.1 AlpA family phage regulatory protein [Citrobacter koseri]HEM8573934.1 AlpA family phage regulatory protein [Citrobacter koseri]